MGTFSADTTTTHANLIPTWYDRVLLETFDKVQRFYQFADKTPLPVGNGQTVVWNRANRLDLGYQLTEATPPSNQALGTAKVSAILKQYGAVTGFSDLADLETVTDLGRMATERLAEQAADTIDTVIQQEICGHAVPGSVYHYTKHSAGAYFTTNHTSASNQVLAGAYLAVSDVRDIAAKLRSLDVPPVQGTDYVCITSPQNLYKLMADSAWTNAHIYVEKGIDSVYQGEAGRIYGVRFFQSTLTRVSVGSADCSNSVQGGTAALSYNTALAHAAFFMGRGFLGAVELDGNIKRYALAGATKSDPLNQTTVYGWKAQFIAKVLNASAGIVAWSGVNETYNASATSARIAAGLLVADPTTSS